VTIVYALLLALATQISILDVTSRTDSDSGILEGVVTDATGALLSKASVRVQRWVSGGQHIGSVVPVEVAVLSTDGVGHYQVALPPGVYDVFISGPAYTPVAVRVKIEARKVKRVNRELKFDPFTKWISRIHGSQSSPGLINCEGGIHSAGRVPQVMGRERRLAG
jgi:hypothetical protein